MTQNLCAIYTYFLSYFNKNENYDGPLKEKWKHKRLFFGYNTDTYLTFSKKLIVLILHIVSNKEFLSVLNNSHILWITVIIIILLWYLLFYTHRMME